MEEFSDRSYEPEQPEGNGFVARVGLWIAGLRVSLREMDAAHKRVHWGYLDEAIADDRDARTLRAPELTAEQLLAEIDSRRADTE